MTESKVHMLFPMTLREKRGFLLHQSLHTSLFEVTMHGLEGDGQVLDVLKYFCHLDSIFSLARTDKANGMLHVSAC